ncbi:4-hydroxythreonine-4-phosphate dehydrogenase [Rhodoligotrophos appendicifer]|uniref:4-hydroxythreonine-4-phosphate dehydrogenase PdxA n=1 Tax=Rhodoligotrophos appendicifer TaxID=987056 RepID=UPI001185FE3F|nr:4-hydroxythreonine-4-phosphate dehydrogenase PdxA [Rhodoligotrophos appendicifer]
MTSATRPLVLSMGEPAGIGPELTLMAWQRRHVRNLPAFAVLGDPQLLFDRSRRLGLDVPIGEIARLADAPAAFDAALPVLPLSASIAVAPGRPDPRAAPLVIEAIARAVDLCLAGDAAALVTNPIAKSHLYQAGFRHPGHTEFLEALSVERGRPARAVMMLAGRGLRTVPLTIHMPLKHVPGSITQSLILDQARIVARDLAAYFHIGHPRLAVSGLNPHAGEDGAMGTEERDIIAPALAILRAEGLDVVGPLPADTMFHEEARATYDVALCMYHDQALIPVKLLDFHEGVNCTLGLPFIRTSPDHGTAFSLAGTGRANPSSLIASIEMAAAMATAGASPGAGPAVAS